MLARAALRLARTGGQLLPWTAASAATATSSSRSTASSVAAGLSTFSRVRSANPASTATATAAATPAPKVATAVKPPQTSTPKGAAAGKPATEAAKRPSMTPRMRALWRAKHKAAATAATRPEKPALPLPPAATTIGIAPVADGMFAVVQISGKQFKVQTNDVIVTNRLLCDVGEKIRLNKVLLTANIDETHIGTPLVENAFVSATVIEHTKTEKVQVFKKKRRKGYAVRQGHRQEISLLRINTVEMQKPKNADEKEKKEKNV